MGSVVLHQENGVITISVTKMEISLERLVKLLDEAFDMGYEGCYELKNTYISELMAKAQTKDASEHKVYKVQELKSFPEGTIFQHSTRGRCWIAIKSNGNKYMQFEKGEIMELCSDEEPWNMPMQLLHTSKDVIA